MRATKIIERTTLAGALIAAILGLLAGAATAALPAPVFLASKKSITKISISDKSGFGQIGIGSTLLSWTGASAKGLLEAPDKVSSATLLFTGDRIGTCEVNSPGAKKGEVVTEQLHGLLGYINESTPVVGVLFEPVTPPTFIEVEKNGCNATKEVIDGSIIGKVSPINSETTAFTFAFGAPSKKQEVTKFEGEATEHRLSIGEVFGFFECDESLTAAEKVEIET